MGDFIMYIYTLTHIYTKKRNTGFASLDITFITNITFLTHDMRVYFLVKNTVKVTFHRDFLLFHGEEKFALNKNFNLNLYRSLSIL